MLAFDKISCCCLVGKLCPSETPWTVPHQAPLSILSAIILEWVAISFSRGSSWPRDRTHVSCITGWFFITEPPGKPMVWGGIKGQMVKTIGSHWDWRVASSWQPARGWALSPIIARNWNLLTTLQAWKRIPSLIQDHSPYSSLKQAT